MKKCPECKEEFSMDFRIPKILNCNHVICLLCIYKNILLKEKYKCYFECNFIILNIKELKNLKIDYKFNERNNFFLSTKKLNYNKAKSRYELSNKSVGKRNYSTIKKKGKNKRKNCKMNNCHNIVKNNEIFCSNDCSKRYMNLSIIKNKNNYSRKNISEFNLNENKTKKIRDFKIDNCSFPNCENLREIYNNYELAFCNNCKNLWINWPENLNNFN